MKRSDVQLIIVLLLISAIGLIAGQFAVQEQQTASQAVIYIKDEEYVRVRLEDPQIVTIEQSGRLNEINITESGFSMIHASCDNQHCLNQGEVTLENVDQRLLGAWIYCLPNEVSIELIRGE